MVRAISSFLLFLVLKGVSASALEAHLLTEYEFLPNKPVAMKNATSKSIQMWCEMHVDSLAENSFFIREIRGRSEVNGTTLDKGNSMNLTIRNVSGKMRQNFRITT